MPSTTELPTWAVYVVSLGTPVSAFVGGLIGQLVSRAGAKELEKRSRREEVMRNLRWAAELAVDEDDRKAQLGISQLDALSESDLLDESQQLFVDAALQSVLLEPIEELEHAGHDAQVIQVVVHDQSGVTDEPTAALLSDEGTEESKGGEDG